MLTNTPTNASPKLDLNNSNYPIFDSEKIDELVPIGNEMLDFKLYDFMEDQILPNLTLK